MKVAKPAILPRNLLWWLVAANMAGFLPMAASAAEPGWFAGAQFGVVTVSARAEGRGSEFSQLSHQGTGHGGLVAGAEFGQRYRLSVSADHGRWDQARSTAFMAGPDRLWSNAAGTGAVYIGPRIGALRFADDITGERNTTFAWGLELGALQDLGIGLTRNGRPLQAGLFLRHYELDLLQRGEAGNGLTRNIRVRRQTVAGLQLVFGF